MINLRCKMRFHSAIGIKNICPETAGIRGLEGEWELTKPEIGGILVFSKRFLFSDTACPRL